MTKLHHKTLEGYKNKITKLEIELDDIEKLIKGFLPKGYSIYECPETEETTYYIIDNNQNIVDEIKSNDDIKQMLYERVFSWLKVYNRLNREYKKLHEIVYP